VVAIARRVTRRMIAATTAGAADITPTAGAADIAATLAMAVMEDPTNAAAMADAAPMAGPAVEPYGRTGQGDALPTAIAGFLAGEPCGQNRNVPHWGNRASAGRLGLAAHPRVGLNDFPPNLDEPAALARGFSTHVT
jgi:hypothetical protein